LLSISNANNSILEERLGKDQLLKIEPHESKVFGKASSSLKK
jgi:hypothetical protein